MERYLRWNAPIKTNLELTAAWFRIKSIYGFRSQTPQRTGWVIFRVKCVTRYFFFYMIHIRCHVVKWPTQSALEGVLHQESQLWRWRHIRIVLQTLLTSNANDSADSVPGITFRDRNTILKFYRKYGQAFSELHSPLPLSSRTVYWKYIYT